MAVVRVMRAVAYPPAVVGHQNGGVHYVSHEVVQGAIVAEALMTAARQEAQTFGH